MRIALIDDDEAVLDSLSLYLERQGLSVVGFASAEAFLSGKGNSGQLDCIVADIRMPGMSGLDLVRELAAEPIPIILITGHGDIDMAVSAIKLGAFDFIEKPLDERRLLESIQAAGNRAAQRSGRDAERQKASQSYQNLTDRQREVMALAAKGLSNKEIGRQLGISARTVEIHRAWMMERMGARNVAELVRMAMLLGIDAAPT
jgi:FixJ family two-component response regulator